MEWTFKKAITIQTYSLYDPIPVPLNLVSSLFMAVWWLWKKCRRCCKGQLDIQNSAARHVSCSACMVILTRNFVTLIRLVKTKEKYFLSLSYYSLQKVIWSYYVFKTLKIFRSFYHSVVQGYFLTQFLFTRREEEGCIFGGEKRGEKNGELCLILRT